MSKNIWSWLFVITCLFGISLLFYDNIWRQVLHPAAVDNLVIQGESPVYEFVAETVRQNILDLKNPFTLTNRVQFPMSWRYALDDVAPINGLYFVLLRIWLNPHQSLMLIVLLSIIFSGFTMHLLLRELRVSFLISWLCSLTFAFTPFVSERIGAHPTYVALYLFVLPPLLWLKVIHATPAKSWKWAIILGICLALPFMTNLYFGVMLVLLIGLLTMSFLIYFPKEAWRLFKHHIRSWIIALIVAVATLSPWIIEAGQILYYGVIDKPGDWNDIIAYSADLTNIVIPSHYNPIYQNIVSNLGNQNNYIRTTFETFVYPGIIILSGLIGYLFVSKKLPKYLKPIFVTAVFFGILTLGPFLQFAGKVTNIPLPYTLIAYIPLLQMARAPARFVVVFVFLGTIIVAKILDYLRNNRLKNSWSIPFVMLLLTIFLLDQQSRVGQPVTVILPNKIYQYLATQDASNPLLEIPFTLRDSIKFFGYQHSHYAPYTTMLHKKPIFGVYAGRIPNHVMSYYTENPLLGVLGRIIDTETKNPESYLAQINYGDMRNALDFYQIQYATSKNNQVYTNTILDIFTKLDFEEILIDGEYVLWQRKLSSAVVEGFDNQGVFDQLMLTKGWSPSEDGESGRWAVGRESEILFNLGETSKSILKIEAESIVESQEVVVLLNGVKIGELVVQGGGYASYQVQLGNNYQKGRNVLTLTFRDTHILAEILPGSQDLRPLALHIKYIGFE